MPASRTGSRPLNFARLRLAARLAPLGLLVLFLDLEVLFLRRRALDAERSAAVGAEDLVAGPLVAGELQVGAADGAGGSRAHRESDRIRARGALTRGARDQAESDTSRTRSAAPDRRAISRER